MFTSRFSEWETVGPKEKTKNTKIPLVDIIKDMKETIKEAHVTGSIPKPYRLTMTEYTFRQWAHINDHKPDVTKVDNLSDPPDEFITSADLVHGKMYVLNRYE